MPMLDDGTPQSAVPAIVSVLVFLGANYVIGYNIGEGTTRSPAAGVAFAAIMPCLTLLLLALTGGGAVRRGAIPRDE
ncbi:hypothetical protein [Sphingomonas nostoxanthinifaciens]|uniref:hypothetical protein n=1 Tax=Sphingomonas nostoxanthinifaciens TaxID=2872652 RepID=UPI001CC1F31F|nr:hypothetical protein [Sphingomonas nostoxanthinifaciens]UAK24578.1 hypothetical protein K8P63_20140 [Sphingomonas nostoxanthinifaciens]